MATDTSNYAAEAQVIPLLQLPAQVPRQAYRQAQSNIPDDKAVRVRLKQITEEHVRRSGAVPPLTLDELTEHTAAVLAEAGLDPIHGDYASILVSNAAWRDSLARIPYERRLLLIPKCLRVEEKCPAPFDEFGLLCKECGLCSIQDLTVEAERLGYAVLVAEGSAIVRSMIETGKIEAIVGVSCINVLEKCFPHMEAAAIPGVAIPLLQDDCVNTTVDLDWVWDLIHLTSDDKTYRLDLDGLKTTVRSWFAADELDDIMGPVDADDATARIARDYLEKGGKRWLYTGDIARMDEDGYFYIVDRKKDMALIGGFNVYPTTVEKAISAHPAVLEVGVAAIPHPERTGQEALKAWIVVKGEQDATAEDIIEFLADKLTQYEIPRRIAFIDELPKTAVGKTLRRELPQLDAAADG